MMFLKTFISKQSTALPHSTTTHYPGDPSVCTSVSGDTSDLMRLD